MGQENIDTKLHWNFLEILQRALSTKISQVNYLKSHRSKLVYVICAVCDWGAV